MGITLVEPEAVKTVALQMLTEATVDVTFYAMCAGVVMDGNVIRGVITESKSGREAVLGTIVVDCTGDEGCTLIWCGDCYDIPYRSLLPTKVDNLIVAGRCIGAAHEAMGAIRVMATCLAMGEAAGRAAKMAIRAGVSPAQIDVRKLQDELVAKGAYLRDREGVAVA